MSDFISLIRPWQWIKNAFVFIGILFSRRFFEVDLVLEVISVFVAFCFASSAVYVFNDLMDKEQDQLHPKKKNRPLAKDAISVTSAVIVGIVFACLSLVLSLASSIATFFILATYMLINAAYSLYLKNIVILDVFCIATGFMLRILAGTIGVGIAPTNWLLLCSLMLTLFLGFSKRRSEAILLKDTHQRQVLGSYHPPLLDEMLSISATGVIVTYSLYTMSPQTIEIHGTANLMLTVPFVIYGLFRYLYLVYGGMAGEDPSRDLIKDRHLVIVVICWAVLALVLTY